MMTSLRNSPASRQARSSLVTVILPRWGGGGYWINLEARVSVRAPAPVVAVVTVGLTWPEAAADSGLSGPPSCSSGPLSPKGVQFRFLREVLPERREKEEAMGEESDRRASQKTQEVLVQGRGAAVDQQQPISPLEGGGEGGGGGALPVLLHVQDGGQQSCFQLLQLLLQHQQEDEAGRS